LAGAYAASINSLPREHEAVIWTLRPLRFLVPVMLFAMVAGCGGDGGDGAKPVPASDASLAALVLEQMTLSPAFSSGTTSYTATVANAIASTRVTPTTGNPAATVRVNGAVVASGTSSDPIALVEGANTITVVVTAQDGATARTYTVVVTRRPPPSSNADLASLALTVASLDQIFDPALSSYSASAGFLGVSTRALAVPADANASLQLNGADLTTGEPGPVVPLVVGSNRLTLRVTAEDAITTRAYAIDVSRATLAGVRQEAYVKASNTGRDRFGTSIGLHGETLVVGAPDEDSRATGINGIQTDDSLADSGAAYVFERNGTDWHQSAYIKASNSDAADLFAGAVAFDGEFLAVGAIGEDGASTGVGGDQADDSAASAGAVYLLRRDAVGAWSQAAYVKASNTESGDQFGSAVALDDGRLLVGAPLEDSNAVRVGGDQANNGASAAGAAYLFERSSTTGTWRQLAYLKATNTASLDEFGSSVAISGDTLAVGAWGEDGGAGGIDGDQADNSVRDAGAVYLYDANTSGAWSPAAYVKASRPSAFDGFGLAVALDGDLLAVGAPRQNSNASGIDGNELDQSMLDAGAVYLFERNAIGDWRQIAFVKASHPSPFDEFGATVALHGSLLAVGAPGQNSSATGINGDERDESMLNAGAVYLFARDLAGEWSQIAFVKASNADPGDAFGSAVDVDGDTLAAGAPFERSASRGINGNETDNSLDSSGAVYVIR